MNMINEYYQHSYNMFVRILYCFVLSLCSSRVVSFSRARLLQVVGQWERAAAAVGNAALIVRLVQGGTLFYMWSECLFGLVEEIGPLAATVAVAVRPVAVYALSSVSQLCYLLSRRLVLVISCSAGE